MTAPDPAATLQALADYYRRGRSKGWAALAGHVEGAAKRADPANCTCEGMSCRCDTGEVDELLAVAAAAGVKP